MPYPKREQIEKKKDDLERAIRQYIFGFSKNEISAEAVKHELNCLFTDIFLDLTNKHNDDRLKNGKFEKLIEIW